MKIITLLLTALTLVPILFVGVTASEYDPWLDTNDDGDIDIFDVVDVATRYGTTGTPINKTALLLELQSSVDSIEERLSQVKSIRYYEASETFVEGKDNWGDAATFTWTPENPTNNAILSAVLYLEWMGGVELEQHNCYGRWHVEVLIDGVSVWLAPVAAPQGNQTEYVETPSMTIRMSYDFWGATWGPAVNIESHTITVRVGGLYISTSCTPSDIYINLYVRNINLILTVVDGLPITE